ncbi:MAG: 2 5 ligase [Bacteroidetes bacterium]|nr:2 5 ligase [Bacteroidota bacterium]
MNKKYFIAIVLPADLFIKAEELKLKLYDDYGLKGALRSPAHLTLHRPFEWKEEKENKLIETLEKFEFNKTFGLELNNFGCFEPRVLFIDVIKNKDLTELHSRLTSFVAQNLKLLNEVEDMRGFHPHITIAFRDLKKALFPLIWQEFKTKKFSGSFEVKSIALLKLENKWEIYKVFNI